MEEEPGDPRHIQAEGGMEEGMRADPGVCGHPCWNHAGFAIVGHCAESLGHAGYHRLAPTGTPGMDDGDQSPSAATSEIEMGSNSASASSRGTD